MEKYLKRPLAAALGAAFLATSVVPLASAEANPFSAEQLSGGYDLVSYAGHGGGKHGEGKCGEGTCGEGTSETAEDKEEAEEKAEMVEAAEGET
tara:strand:- start:2684 stop:2965 length:282 start_codon:yes stop_codon:yes gene_type:complete